MLSIIILAAGQGKRMRSTLPKVLHRVAGKSLLEHVHDAASRLLYRDMRVVYGHGGEQVLEALSGLKVEWVEQAEQLGTGHAVKLALPAIADTDQVLVLYGDIPLISSQTLHRLVQAAEASGFSLLTCRMENSTGYGRIVRDGKGGVTRIVEDKDATEGERAIDEVNTGMMVVQARLLRKWLDGLGNDNAQGEYYLTDIVEKAIGEGVAVNTINPQSPVEISGINNRAQLAEIERAYQLREANRLMEDGVTMLDPARFDLRGTFEAGTDVVVDVNVVIEGAVRVGSNVSIGPNCYIRNAEIADGVSILPNCVIEDAVIGRDCRIGPFARLRPGTRLDEAVHVGNFVELKQSAVGPGTKINHLSYVGDSLVGRGVNVGAGTITCNYDGANKHTTTIEDEVFIGSDTQLVAPVKVGRGATIGAGTTVTRDVEPDTLVFNSTERKIVKDWKKPVKRK